MSDAHESPDEFLAAHRARKRVMTAVAVVASVAIGAGVVAFVATRKPTPKRPPADAQLDPKTAEDLDRAYLEHRRQGALDVLGKACDADDANHELKLLGEDDDWEGITIVGNAWLGRCPDDEQIRWKLFKALEELERWPEAEAQATRLIAMNVTDVDYWWWRGQARKNTGDVAGSTADYRQSIALSDMADSRGINVMGYGDVAPTVGRACEAAFAMRWWGHRNEGDLNDAAERKLRSLAEFGACDGARGEGQATVTLDTPLTVKLDVAELPARIDLHVPYVVIGADAAAKAGLDLSSAQPIDLVLDATITPAKLVRFPVSVGALTASDIEIAVVDAIAPARIGLGFWWRFDWAPSDDGLTAVVSPMADPGAL
jgi:hypothetical protein